MHDLENVVKETDFVLKPVLAEYVERVKESGLKSVLEYCTQTKVSCDRALFVRLGCEAVGGDWHKIIPAMVAVEMMDFSVIVVDDILDEAPRRMERTSVYRKWNKKIAIIAASILKSISTKALIEAGIQNELDAENLRKLVTILEDTHRQIYIGQYLDIEYEKIDFDKVTEEMYLEMVKYTTGVQISACSQIGGLLGKGNKSEVRALREYGLYTGMIFQIRDDFIDYIDEEQSTKKTPFLDLIQHKKRLPIMLAYRDSPEKINRILRKSKLQEQDKKEISTLVSSSRVIDSTNKLVNGLMDKALVNLKLIRESRVKSVFEEILKLGTDI